MGNWTTYGDCCGVGRRLADLPRDAVGLYAIYVCGQLIYVGMSRTGIIARLWCHLHPPHASIRHQHPRPSYGSGTLGGFYDHRDIEIKLRVNLPVMDIAAAEERLIWRLRPRFNKVIFHRGRVSRRAS